MFTTPLFWFLMGIIFVFVAASARAWAEDLRLRMNWWKWLLAAIWYGLLNLTFAAPFTLLGENETQAATFSIIFLLVISIILGVVLWRLLLIGGRAEAEIAAD
jgi:hypothetical protein